MIRMTFKFNQLLKSSSSVWGEWANMEKASAFEVGRNGYTGAARHRVYFGKGFSSTSGRQLGAGK